MFTPTDIANRALDAAGIDFVLGDISDGSREGQVCLRSYGECVRQLLRSAHWDFARQCSPLTLLADASGQTPNVGSKVIIPFLYEYAYPPQCMKLRFIPVNPFANQSSPVPPGNIQPPNPSSPVVAGLGQSPYPGTRLRPARFLIATDPNYAATQGQMSWETQGASPQSQTVICTNVQNAQAVFTALMFYPSNWDSLFRAAMVAYLASEISLPLSKDKKFGLELRAQNIGIVKAKLDQARISDGNEMTASSDIRVDWMSARYTGGRAWFGGDGNDGSGPGITWSGWDSCGFCDGSSY